MQRLQRYYFEKKLFAPKMHRLKKKTYLYALLFICPPNLMRYITTSLIYSPKKMQL